MEEIKKRIKDSMNANNLNVTELANKSGLSKGTVSKYINGRMEPKYGAIAALARALNCSPAWLLGLDDEDTTDPDMVLNQFLIQVRKLSPDGQLKVKNFVKFLLFEEGLDDGDSKV